MINGFWVIFSCIIFPYILGQQSSLEVWSGTWYYRRIDGAAAVKCPFLFLSFHFFSFLPFSPRAQSLFSLPVQRRMLVLDELHFKSEDWSQQRLHFAA